MATLAIDPELSSDTDSPTQHHALLAWVEEVAAFTKPAAIRWCDGSQAEWDDADRPDGRLRHTDPARSGQAPEQLLRAV